VILRAAIWSHGFEEGEPRVGLRRRNGRPAEFASLDGEQIRSGTFDLGAVLLDGPCNFQVLGVEERLRILRRAPTRLASVRPIL
jgi:hypothetical protein